MALYVYKKNPVRRFPFLSAGISLIPFVFIVFGLALITWVAYPIISFQLFLSPKFTALIRPIPDEIIVQAMENETRVLGVGDDEESLDAVDQIDYTRASNWFPQKPPEMIGSDKKEYLL